MTVPTNDNKSNERYTFYILTNDWTGLHDMFEKGSMDAIGGVPLVPMFWKMLAERGHEVHVFVLGNFSSDKDYTMSGFHVHRGYSPQWLSGTVMKGRPIRTFLKLGWLWNQLSFYTAGVKWGRKSPPDVIYAYRATPAVVGSVLAKKFKSLFIQRKWGTWLGYLLFNKPWYRRLRSFGEVLSYKIPCDLIIMSNDGTLGDKVAERLKFPPAKHRFWIDGTARGIYQPDLDRAAVKRSVGVEPSEKMIFSVARLDFWKRLDRTIDAMPAVLKRVPNARLVIAGSGPLRGDLETQIAKLGLEGRVLLLGQTPHEKVRQLHNAADLFVTVQDLTNLGNQFFEAMHSGACMIAYDIGGTRDFAVDGENCVLLKEPDLPKLGDVIADLLLDDQRRKRLGQGALEYARKYIWFWDQRVEIEIDEVCEMIRRHRQELRPIS